MMTEEEIIEIVEDYINYIRFKGNARYSINQWFMAIEDLLDLYNKEKVKINLLKETICESLNKLAIYDNTEAIKIQTEFNKKIKELK